ncbi:DUF1893 domain-containing protein [Faecalicatena contorta]|uniref:DUF1893 domain-containing protein n=1 Tax=Faecalicatena contorta TaxID=39482 RepID=UPI001F26B50E|nr:DUF1893 domain-containing protein [Faecalicatena contorta]MCF2679340.1 DUF1893 domain-containing protein [Faecalicatena contorta]
MENKYMQTAKEMLLQRENATCVVLWEERDGNPYISEEKGIRPLMELLAKGETFEKAYIADKVIGKAAAFLAVYGGAAAVYAKIISSAAKEVFKEAGIKCEYEKEVPYIINRAGTGRCPMESAVWDEKDPAAAYEILKEKTKIS